MGHVLDFTDPEVAARAKSNRDESVRPLVQSDGNPRRPISVAASEKPRSLLLWATYRKDHIVGELVGIQRALSNCIDDTREIKASGDVFADHLISFWSEPGDIRLRLWPCFLRPIQYLSMENRHYTKGLRIILRGVRKPCVIKYILEALNFCPHSGEEPKINEYPDTLAAHARPKSI